MFDKRSQTPVESRNYELFYVAFSGLLFLGTVWAVWDEVKVRRPWKEYQARYYELYAQKTDSLRQAALQEIDSSQAAQLNQALAEANKGLESDEYMKTVKAKEKLQEDLDIATREWRFARSRSDAAYFQYKKALSEGKSGLSEKVELDKHDAAIARHFGEKTDLESKVATLDIVVNKYKDAVMKAQADLKAMYAKANGFASKIEKAKAAPIAVRQLVLNDFELTPFQEIKARVDRCQTCHAGWADDVMADAPEPYRKHPMPELLAKHNPETFGCTPCHRGQGPALTTGFAHGDEDHYWETPILRGNDVYATCNSCHYNESVLKYAQPFTRAKQLIIDSGCYGCHEIKGYSDLAKIGPPLNSVTAKAKPEWIFRWVRNPKEYNPHTRMPNFKFTDDQAEAVTAFLVNLSKSSNFEFARPRGSFVGGSAAQGKRIFESVGCQACHVAGNFMTVRDSRGTTYDIAPELTRVGSKVTGDWLFDWLKNPRHYNPETRMPSLRLSDSEARDVVAYLLTMKDDRTFEKKTLDLGNPDLIARGDKLIREYGCFGCHDIKGTEKEGKVSVELSEFGRKKAEQMDFGDTKELSHVGTEEFRVDSTGAVWVQHTWRGWVYGKLRNPRQYLTERIAQKMPIFTFNDEEIRELRLFLISMTKDVPLPKYQQVYDKRKQDIEAGRRVTMRYNCMQCHQLEDRGGYVLAKYEEPAIGPPLLPESQGAKVQEPWLHNFLKNPTTIRPWLQIRMPTFSLTDEEVSKVQKYFLGMSKQDLEIRDYAATVADPKYVGTGKKLFDTYQCGKCHPSGPVKLGGEQTASDLAPNLAMASSRLKPEWIIQWLNDPQKLQPGTRMPAFFFEGKGPDETVYGGSSDEQIKALQNYVWSLGRRSAAVADIK
ncbi:MAG: cytochrome c [Bacteroidota bacterium]